MKLRITASIMVCLIAAPVAADSISVSVGIATNSEQDPNVATIDKCTLRIDTENQTQSAVDFTALVMPKITAGSLSSYTFSILNKEPVPVFSTLDPRQEASTNVAFQGLDWTAMTLNSFR